jgi:xanthine dehydrogenase accessory factor
MAEERSDAAGLWTPLQPLPQAAALRPYLWLPASPVTYVAVMSSSLPPGLHGRAAVATLVATEGSSPKHPGAKMWVDAEGRILGSVTIGGCVDARVIEESERVIAEGVTSLVRMSLGDEDAWALGMTCGGVVEVLVEPTDGDDPGDAVTAAMRVARAEVDAGRPAVVVAPLDGANARLVVATTRSRGSLGDGALDAAAMRVASELLEQGASGIRTVTAAGAAHRLYFERHAPPATLVIFGATQVAMALVSLARVLGLRSVVVDGRERFATRERFPEADELIVGMPSEIAEELSLGPSSLAVLLSHDYKYDLPVLRKVLASDASYVGVLGSARRGRAMLEFLGDQGVPADQLARVRVPVGLDIGATTAEEIALSVLAEALAVQRGRLGGPMRDRRREGAAWETPPAA